MYSVSHADSAGLSVHAADCSSKAIAVRAHRLVDLARPVHNCADGKHQAPKP